MARTSDELLVILNEVLASHEAYETAESAIAEWTRALRPSKPIRAELISGGSYDSEGCGAGAGTVER